MLRIGELLRSNTFKHAQRMEALVSTANVDSARAAHTLQDLSARSSDQLTTIGQRGSRFYQSSESYSSEVRFVALLAE